MKSKTVVILIVFGILFSVAMAVAFKGNVYFPHHMHQDNIKDCNVCHNLFPQQAGVIQDLKNLEKLKKKQVMNKKCLKCHRAKKKAGEKTGPTSCSKCHLKPA